jgi:hypothetical protein
MLTIVWDIARDGGATCSHRQCQIGQGEAYRIGKRGPICEACSIRLDDQHAPKDITPMSFVDRLRHDIAMGAAARQPAPGLRIVPGSQPTIDPRSNNRRCRRHGVVEQVRATTETDWNTQRHDDWAKRAAGDRDE